MNERILYSVYSGSQLYGLATPESDVDIVSVFMPTSYDLLSLQHKDYVDDSTKNSSEERRNTKEDTDHQLHSLPRFINLLLNANPNLFEILFADEKNIISSSTIIEHLKKHSDKFLSQKIYDSFMGFAVSQKKKLTYKKERYGELKEALTFLETGGEMGEEMTEQEASNLNNILFHYKGSKQNIERFHKGLPTRTIYAKIKEEYENYGWRLHTPSFERLGFDCKFAAHNIRLLVEGEQLLLTGKLKFPLTDEAFIDIMNIKLGKVSIDDFYRLSYKWEERCRLAKEKGSLPAKPNFKWANAFLVDTLAKEIIKNYKGEYRWHEQ